MVEEHGPPGVEIEDEQPGSKPSQPAPPPPPPNVNSYIAASRHAVRLAAALATVEEVGEGHAAVEARQQDRIPVLRGAKLALGNHAWRAAPDGGKQLGHAAAGASLQISGKHSQAAGAKQLGRPAALRSSGLTHFERDASPEVVRADTGHAERAAPVSSPSEKEAQTQRGPSTAGGKRVMDGARQRPNSAAAQRAAVVANAALGDFLSDSDADVVDDRLLDTNATNAEPAAPAQPGEPSKSHKRKRKSSPSKPRAVVCPNSDSSPEDSPTHFPPAARHAPDPAAPAPRRSKRRPCPEPSPEAHPGKSGCAATPPDHSPSPPVPAEPKRSRKHKHKRRHRVASEQSTSPDHLAHWSPSPRGPRRSASPVRASQGAFSHRPSRSPRRPSPRHASPRHHSPPPRDLRRNSSTPPRNVKRRAHTHSRSPKAPPPRPARRIHPAGVDLRNLSPRPRGRSLSRAPSRTHSPRSPAARSPSPRSPPQRARRSPGPRTRSRTARSWSYSPRRSPRSITRSPSPAERPERTAIRGRGAIGPRSAPAWASPRYRQWRSPGPGRRMSAAPRGSSASSTPPPRRSFTPPPRRSRSPAGRRSPVPRRSRTPPRASSPAAQWHTRSGSHAVQKNGAAGSGALDAAHVAAAHKGSGAFDKDPGAAQQPSAQAAKPTSGVGWQTEGAVDATHESVVARLQKGVHSDRAELEARAIALAQAAGTPQLGPNAAATRHARRIYVGNLVSGVTENEIHELFNKALMAAGCSVAVGAPVVATFINHEKHFGFVETRAVEEASNMLLLDGLVCHGAPLSLRRPNDYNYSEACKLGPTLPDTTLNLTLVHLVVQLLNGTGNKVYVENLPPSVTEADLKTALAAASQVLAVSISTTYSGGRLQGSGVLELSSPAAVDSAVTKLHGMHLADHKIAARRVAAGHEADKALQELVDIHQQKLTRRRGSTGTGGDKQRVVVRLSGALELGDVRDLTDQQALTHDIATEVRKYGELVSVVVPGPATADNGSASDWTGDVCLQYKQPNEAERAAEALEGRLFGDVPLKPQVEAV